MKLYRVDSKSSEETAQTREWFGNKKSAEKAARASAYGDYEARITEVDVPTTRVALLDFLNENLWQNPNWEAR